MTSCSLDYLHFQSRPIQVLVIIFQKITLENNIKRKTISAWTNRCCPTQTPEPRYGLVWFGLYFWFPPLECSDNIVGRLVLCDYTVRVSAQVQEGVLRRHIPAVPSGNNAISRVVGAGYISGLFWYPVYGRIFGFICRISGSSMHKIVDIVRNTNYFLLCNANYLRNRKN